MFEAEKSRKTAGARTPLNFFSFLRMQGFVGFCSFAEGERYMVFVLMRSDILALYILYIFFL